MISSDALADPAIDPCTGTSNPAGSSASCVPTGDMTEMCYWDGGSSKIVCDVAAYCDDTTYGSVSQIVANTSTAGVTTDYVYWGGCENGAKTWCCIIDDPSDEIGRIEISATDQHDFLAGVYTGGYMFHPLGTSFVLQLEGRDGDDDLLASTHAAARTSAIGGAGADFTCGPAGNEDCCHTIPVPGGKFTNYNWDSSKPEGSQFRPSDAEVSAFALDEFEVTVGRLRAFFNAKQGNLRDGHPKAGDGAHPLIAGTGWRDSWNVRLPGNFQEINDRMINACSEGGDNANWGATTWTAEPGANESKCRSA